MSFIAQVSAIMRSNPEFVLIGLVASVAVLAYSIFKDSDYFKELSPFGSNEEGVEYEELKRKSIPDLKQRLHTWGQDVNMEFQVGGSQVGTAKKSIRMYASDEIPIGVDDKNSRKEEGDEEKSLVRVFLVSTASNSKWWFFKDILADKDDDTEIFVCYDEDVVDEYGVVKIDTLTGNVNNFGGVNVQSGTAPQNVVAEIPVRKALERHINNTDEYVKQVNYWNSKHSEDMGKYEKEAELEERRFGNRLGNR